MAERELLLAGAMGFCNGVRRALDLVERELAAGHTPLYVLHEIVHNNYVVERLRERGVLFVDDLAGVPEGSRLVLSAHGTAREVREKAEKYFHVVDATCPLVRKVHQAAMAAEKAGERILLLGHPGHPEVIGIMGQCSPGAIEVVSEESDFRSLDPDDGRKVCLLSQTTLNADDVAEAGKKLTSLFASVRNGAEVCYATRDRQKAVRRLAGQVDHMLILGSSHSSNSRRLLETALRENISATLVDFPQEIDAGDLDGVQKLGLTAGASVPDALIRDTVEHLQKLGFVIPSSGQEI